MNHIDAATAAPVENLWSVNLAFFNVFTFQEIFFMGSWLAREEPNEKNISPIKLIKSDGTDSEIWL